MAYFDLLGTKSFSSDENNYFESINIFRSRIIDNVPYLQDNNNLYNISFFSDCCYVESQSLPCILSYLENLRDDLISKHLFFNAAVIKVDYIGDFSSFETTEKGGNDKKVVGTLFKSNIISEVYNAQNSFKGIGIWIDPRILTSDSIKEKSLKEKTVTSFFVDSIENTMHISKYTDIKLVLSGLHLEKGCLNSIIKSYFFACCETPRVGRYYSSLLINIINSDSSDIHWNIKNERFENTSYIYELIFDMIRDEEQFSILTGFEYVAFAFINRIYNSSLDKVSKFNITRLFLKEGSIGNKYITDLDHIPVDLLRSNNKDNVDIFKNYCRQFILTNKVSKYTSHD